MARVILFRTPTPNDIYDATFAAAGYDMTSIPALGDHLLPDELVPILAAGGREWEAAIITSRRAAEAWVLAARRVGAERKRSKPTEASEVGEPWSAVPVWSPGAAVGSVFTSSGLPEAYIPKSAPTAVSAAALAPLILDAPLRAPSSAASSEGGYRPYLVLTGDKTLPLLTECLRAAGREVRRVKVYETTEDPGLGKAVRSLATGSSSSGGAGEGEAVWIALFSPSSAGFVLPHLEAAGYDLRAGNGGRARLAAIGETTEAALRAEGWRVDAVAETPDAQGLVAAIVAAERESG